jgi:ferric-dicitrate binding protein FerR (iron transport regulator)
MTQPNNTKEDKGTSIQDSVARLLDGELTDSEFADLSQILMDDPEARQVYFDCISLETCLEKTFCPPLSRKPSLSQSGRAVPRSITRTAARWSAGIAAVAAAIALTVMYFTPTDPPSSEIRLRVCGNSQWSVDGSASPETNTLPQGVEFQLQQGVVELKLPYDVTAIVEAPATITLIDDRTLRLDQGKALFQVPTEKGKGFTVVTPHQRIVDLGTEFGIRFSNKHPDQLELHVLQGKVRIDALENDSDSPDQGTILKKGRAVLLAGTRVLRELDNTQTTFRRELPEKVDILFEDDFESGLLPEKKYAVRIERYAVRNAAGKYFPGIADDTTWHFTTPPSAHVIFVVGFETPNITGAAVTAIAPGWSEDDRKGASGLRTSAISTEGSQHAWLNGPATNGPTTSHITLDQPITAGTTYILTADVGQTANFHGSQGTLSLYGSDQGFSSPLATTTASPPRGEWLREQSVSFTATSDIASGQKLGISLSCTGGPQAIFDNLHVYATPPTSTPQVATFTPSPGKSNTPPVITALSPANGTTTGSPDGKLRLSFDQPIETNAGRFIVKNLTDDTESMIPVKDSRVIVEGNTIAINPPTELADGERHMGRINGWQTNAWVGIFNPKGTGTRYHHDDDLWDSQSTPGTIGAMQGPTMATFDSTPPNTHIRRQLGTITPDSRYTVSLAIGVRSDDAANRASFDGYTIRLTSGDTILATLSNDTPPGPANSVTTVSFSWDSSDTLSNAPLTLGISPNHASGTSPGYLDIDAVRVSVLGNK